MKTYKLYRVEWMHNGNWRMEENGGWVFSKKEEAEVAAENAKAKSPTLVTRVVEFTKSAKVILATIIFASLMAGCQQFKKLTDTQDMHSNVIQIQGTYENPSVALNGSYVKVTFYLIQNGADITNGNLDSLGAETLHATPDGVISGNHLHVTLDEGKNCPNKLTGDGDFSGNVLTITIYGLANAQPGCYPKDVNFTTTLVRP